jgi:hypothetical protein
MESPGSGEATPAGMHEIKEGSEVEILEPKPSEGTLVVASPQSIAPSRAPSLSARPRIQKSARSATAPTDLNQLLNELEPELPDLVAAVRTGWASFDQLCDASDGKDDNKSSKTTRNAYAQIYPLVRATFERAHGQIVSAYLNERIQAYAAVTRPPDRRWLQGGAKPMQDLNAQAIELQAPAKTRWPFNLTRRSRPAFHFTYDLATAPVAGQLFSRITQLGFDARRIVPRARLAECMDQLYSTTTDLIGIIEAHGRTDRNLERWKIAIARRDLDQVELRYLQVTARLLYFAGVITGTCAAVLGSLLIGVAAGLDSIGVTAVMFAAVGALLSVVQKMADDKLTVRYVVGQFYLWILGFVRPIIGAFAGLLLQLALAAGLIPLSVSGNAGKAYILLLGFAIGFAERSIPDVFSRAGVSTGLPAPTSEPSVPSEEEPTKSKTKKRPLTRRKGSRR